jgi:hypothetical protein
MANKKFNKELLNEELKRFKSLTNYDYYVDKPNISENFPIVKMEDDRPEMPKDDMIIYGMSEAEGDESTDDNFEDEIEDITSDIDSTPEANQEIPVDQGAEPAPEETPDELPAEEIPVDQNIEPASDEVELDVTELVRGSEAAKESADAANEKITQLMDMVNKLESQLSGMSAITDKIDGLEKEIERRNPTPVEKLEMRSLDSFPYNIKLSDFWSEKGERYDTGSEEKQPEEYILTQQDVDNDYRESDIEDSFDIDKYEGNNM